MSFDHEAHLDMVDDCIIRTMALMQRSRRISRELQAEWERDQLAIEQSKALLDGLLTKPWSTDK